MKVHIRSKEGVWPVDTGRKLNVHKTFRIRPGRLLNVLCTFNLRPVSAGYLVLGILENIKNEMHSFDMISSSQGEYNMFDFRCVFKTLLNIYDEAVFQK